MEPRWGTMLNVSSDETTERAVRLGEGTGPLRGIRVVELAGIGPGPHACMLLADLGADVIRVESPRPGLSVVAKPAHDILTRGRPSVVLNLKNPAGLDALLQLIDSADVLIEGFRPGAAERLGVGPEDCRERNPRLIYARMTGWGQDGPLAQTAGHDLNYVALTGVLHGLGQDPARPQFPANLVGDFGGGSTYLVIGVLAALLERGVSGQGQTVDAAIVDGTAHLAAMTFAQLAGGAYREERGVNLLEGGVPFYDLYETADGEHLSVGPLEPRFFNEFIATIGLADVVPPQGDVARYGELRELLARTIRTRTRDEWAQVFAGTDSCVAPVLRLSEAGDHPHLRERGVIVEHDGVAQPAPAPRFSRTQATLRLAPSRPGQHTREALNAWGVADVEALIESGAAVQKH